MRNHIKYPVLIATLILIAYVIAIVLWNVDISLGALLIVFASSLIGAIGSVISVMEIIRTKKKMYISINFICLIITAVAALIPFISFAYVDIYGF